jgi:hypothetical protein
MFLFSPLWGLWKQTVYPIPSAFQVQHVRVYFSRFGVPVRFRVAQIPEYNIYAPHEFTHGEILFFGHAILSPFSRALL